MTRRKIIYHAMWVVELLLILFCCVWLLCETVHDLGLPLSGKNRDSTAQSICLSNGTVIRVAVLDDAFAWPVMRRNEFNKKCVVSTEDGKRYVRIVEISCNSLVVPLVRRIAELGNVQDIDEFLEISLFETQMMMVINFYLMINVHLFFVAMVLLCCDLILTA